MVTRSPKPSGEAVAEARRPTAADFFDAAVVAGREGDDTGHEPTPTGEHTSMLERVIITPTTGTFRSSAPQIVTTEGEIVVAGQAIGVVQSLGQRVTVISPFAGFLMGFLAADAERVRAGQPIAWLRSFGHELATTGATAGV